MNEIKRQLNKKLGDTNERSSRVIQKIEGAKKMKQSPKKTKASGVIYIGLASFVTVLALFLLLNPGNNGGPSTSTTPDSNEKNPTINEPVAVSYKELLRKYFKEEGDVAYFKGSGNEYASFTETTNWMNDDYVQILVDNGGTTTQNIYRITDTNIELVLTRNAEDEIVKPSFAELASMETISIMLQAPFEQESYTDFPLYTNVPIQTPYGTLNTILVITEGEGISISRYYAEGLGLVAEIYEMEDGYKIESYLTSINEPASPNEETEVEVYNESTQMTDRYPIATLPFVDPYLYEIKKDYYNLTYRMLTTTSEGDLGILSYACNEKEECSHVFVKKDGAAITPIVHTYGSYGNVHFTPNQEIIGIPIHSQEHDENSQVERNQIVLINVNTFKQIIPSTAPIYFESALHPIVGFNLANTYITLTVADLASIEHEAVAEWEKQSPRKVKELVIPFD